MNKTRPDLVPQQVGAGQEWDEVNVVAHVLEVVNILVEGVQRHA
jgi:hypothetical protein